MTRLFIFGNFDIITTFRIILVLSDTLLANYLQFVKDIVPSLNLFALA